MSIHGIAAPKKPSGSTCTPSSGGTQQILPELRRIDEWQIKVKPQFQQSKSASVVPRFRSLIYRRRKRFSINRRSAQRTHYLCAGTEHDRPGRVYRKRRMATGSPGIRQVWLHGTRFPGHGCGCTCKRSTMLRTHVTRLLPVKCRSSASIAFHRA